MDMYQIKQDIVFVYPNRGKLHLDNYSLQQFLIEQVHSINEHLKLPMVKLEEQRLLGYQLDYNLPMEQHIKLQNKIHVKI